MSTPIGLNVFQRLLRRWDVVHPYNAGQAMHVVGALDASRWQEAWNRTLERMGLGPIEVDGNRYRYTASAVYTVQLVAPDTTFEQHVSHQLNVRFVESQLPFRPFLMATTDAFWAGVIYAHWVADSVSIRMLMREWFAEAMQTTPSRSVPVTIAREGYWPLFGPQQVPWRVGDALLATVRSLSRFRSVRRLHGMRSDDYTMSFLVRDARPGLVQPLRQYARRLGVTVNDIFLAAALEQCAAHLPLRRSVRRRRLAMGTIVDLRPASRRDLRNTFGMFLGFANVMASDENLRDFSHFLRSLQRQTQHAKRTHATAAGTVWLYLSMIANRFLPPERSYSFYRKHMPLAGGISNVNLVGSWAAEYHPRLIRQYVRISPTGPMIPVAFTPTSLGEDLHLAMTYRAAVLPHEKAQQMARGFLARIEALTLEHH